MDANEETNVYWIHFVISTKNLRDTDFHGFMIKITEIRKIATFSIILSITSSYAIYKQLNNSLLFICLYT